MTYHNINVSQNQYCPECGTINSVDARFCGGCGAQLIPLKSLDTHPSQSNTIINNQVNYNQSPQNSYYPTSPQSYYVNDPNYGAPQDYQNNQNMYEHRTYGFRPGRKDPSLAIILTLFIPGAAHMYTDKILEGLIFSIITYALELVFVGIVIHLYFIFTASERTKVYNRILGYPE